MLEKCRAGAGLLSHIIASKYGDHLPLHRQEGVFARHGMDISSKTLSEWVGKISDLVSPVFLPEFCTRVGCWAHVRRKFVEVQKVSGKESAFVLKAISQIYAVEKKARHLTPEERLATRQKKAVPLLQSLRGNLDAFNERTLRRHLLKKALEYTLSQWDELSVILTDGLLEADNNMIEREMRPIALGRKNNLFAGTDDGARWAATL